MKVTKSRRVGVALAFFLLTASASAAYPSNEDLDRLDLGASGNCSNGDCDDSDDDEPKCPPDSSVDPIDGNCVCTLRHCFQPTCHLPSKSVLRRRGTNLPGDCCDVYECVSPHEKNCSEVVCATDVEKCPDDSYRLPAHKSPEDCCSTPQSCQCLPRGCEPRGCPAGQRPREVRPGNNKPGTCCPLIDCVPDLKTNDSCLVNDSHVMMNGSSWWKDPCTYCSCLNGYLFCNASNSHNCPENPAGCLSAGRLYENGDTWDEDPCTHCTCENGEKKCDAYMCQICVNPRYIPGECCPECDESSVVTLSPGCPSFRNCSLRCPRGYVVDEAGCYLCQCQTGTSQGPTISTDVTTFETAHNRGGSCYTSDGSVHEDGETWHDGCRECLCHGGIEMCNLVLCPRLNCVNPVFNSTTDCCATCPDDLHKAAAPLKTVFCHSLDGTYKKEGEIWSMSACTSCICHRGLTLCETRQCPATPCPRPITDPGHCCPYCPQVPVDESEGKSCSFSHPHGSVWKQGNCESCKCDNGQAICYTQQCNVSNCEHPVLQKNQCCNICVEKIWKDFCRVGNTSYQSSEKWMEDECTRCVCNDGHSVCTKQLCPLTFCDNPVRRPGHCCPICDPGEVAEFDSSPTGISIYNIIITILIIIIACLIVCILLLCRRSRRYCVTCPDSACLARFTTLTKPKFNYDSSHSDYTTEKAKLASV